MVAQEASHCGCPCVIFENTGLTSIIENKINGFVAKYSSPDSIAKGIEWCFDEMENSQKRIHHYTKKKFDTEGIVKSYTNFISS